MMWDNWVIDASDEPPLELFRPGTFCFIPVEGDVGSGKETYVTGMNFIGAKPPHNGQLVGIIHGEGTDAANKYYAAHREEIEALLYNG